MRPAFPSKINPFKSAIAGLLMILMLLVTLASTCHWLHWLHGQFHSGADHGQSPCAVCTIAKGQLTTPVAQVSEVFASLSVAWTLPFVLAASFTAIDLSVASSRGPPPSVSSQS